MPTYEKTLDLKPGDVVMRALAAIGDDVPLGGVEGVVKSVHPRVNDPWLSKVKVAWSNGYTGSVEIRFLRRREG